MHYPSKRHAVGTPVFAVTVLLLLVLAASGFLLYATKPITQGATTVTMSQTMSESMSASSTSGAMAETAAPAIAFVASSGQMFGQGWLIVAPLENGSYAIAVHATGLEPASMGDYIVEAAQNSGQMATVPIAGANDTQSEFTADASGVGQFFAVLHEEPSSVFESVSIVYLPGMEMQDAAVVATASLTM